jgi:hypothetical protein
MIGKDLSFCLPKVGDDIVDGMLFGFVLCGSRIQVAKIVFTQFLLICALAFVIIPVCKCIFVLMVVRL